MPVDRLTSFLVFTARYRVLSITLAIAAAWRLSTLPPRSVLTWMLDAVAMSIMPIFAWWNDGRYLREIAAIETDYRAAVDAIESRTDPALEP